MLRVAAWTGGLFAIGAGVAHYFPGSWTEPVVLAALGATMWLLAGRRAAPSATAPTVEPPQQLPIATARPARAVR